MYYSWRIQCPTGTYHVSQRECHLLQRVQNLPAAWSCSLRSLVGAGDDFVSVPPTDHQELWTGNYYQNKNVGHNLLKINLVHRQQQCFIPGHPWTSSTQRQEKASTLTLHDSSPILREGTRAHVQLHYLQKRHKQELYSPLTSWPTQQSHSTSLGLSCFNKWGWWHTHPLKTGSRHYRPFLKGSDSHMLFQNDKAYPLPISWNKFHYSCPAD